MSLKRGKVHLLVCPNDSMGIIKLVSIMCERMVTPGLACPLYALRKLSCLLSFSFVLPTLQSVHNREQYSWTISTGLLGFGTPPPFLITKRNSFIMWSEFTLLQTILWRFFQIPIVRTWLVCEVVGVPCVVIASVIGRCFVISGS